MKLDTVFENKLPQASSITSDNTEMRVVIIVTVLSIICGVEGSNQELEQQLISALNDFFKFDHNLFVIEESSANHFFNAANQVPRTIFTFKNNERDNFTVLERLTEIHSKNTLLIIILDGSSLYKNAAFLIRFKSLQRLQTSMKIGLFFTQLVSLEDIKQLFQWCNESLIVNIFVAFYITDGKIEGRTAEGSLNLFTFNSFGSFDIINVTASEKYEDLYPSLQSNFQQHKLRLTEEPTLLFDIHFWSTIFQLMNASFIIDDTNNFTVAEEFFQNGTDVSLIWFIQQNEKDIYVYPLVLDWFIIIVPEASSYTGFLAFLRIMTSDKVFVYALITVIIAILFLSFSRYVAQKRVLFFESIVDVFNLLMNDNVFVKYRQLSYAEIFAIGPLTFAGFVIVNGILSNLQSYLTRPVNQHQIKTLEELYESPFPILAFSEWKEEFVDTLTKQTKYPNWSKKVISIPNYIDDAIWTFNTSISFYANAPHVEYLFRAQKRLNIKGFYNPQLRVLRKFMSYPLNEKFIFFERYNEIVHRMQTAGLINLWTRWEYDDLEILVMRKNREHLINTGRRHDLQKIEFPVFIVYGWILGSITFIVEIFWRKSNSGLVLRMTLTKIMSGVTSLSHD